eukprot:Hpha_TRINITY_DN36181_c0_g1::TRINITY_DN36181_c0_g1_i1::g.36230::m.36230
MGRAMRLLLCVSILATLLPCTLAENDRRGRRGSPDSRRRGSEDAKRRSGRSRRSDAPPSTSSHTPSSRSSGRTPSSLRSSSSSRRSKAKEGEARSKFLEAAKVHQGYKKSQDKKKHYKTLTPEQRAAALHVPPANTPITTAPGIRRAPGDFDPGSLNIPTEKVLRKCLIPHSQYKEHLLTGATMTSYKHKVALLMGPKAGSSTSRHIILMFDGKDEGRRGLRKLDKKIWRAWVVREPLSRFYAQYEEMIARSWHAGQGLPMKYSFRDGMPKYDTYANLFDDEEGTTSLAKRFELFVHEYDGTDPFDVHLVQQVPSLSTPEGPLRADLVAETKDLSKVLAAMRAHARPKLADQRLMGTDFAKQLVSSGGRAFPRRMNVSAISDAAKQRVCMLAAIDYCCLNWKLPEPCLNAPPGRRVRCAHVDGKIEPVIA